MNITFAHDVTEEEMEALMKQPDINQEAIDVYKSFKPADVVAGFLNSTHPKKDNIIKTLRCCPEFSLSTMSTPAMFNKFGIWPEIKGWKEMQASPRYFPGR